jgi:uncharacterized RDD family membrane protein YckC
MKIVGDASKARFIALFTDNLLATALTFALGIPLPENWVAMKVVVLVAGYLGYFIVFEALWSRTPGKYFQGLIVRKLDGRKSDWVSAVVRSVLRIVEVNPVLLGGIPAGLIVISSERKQRLGDMLAGTVVVSDKLTWDAEDNNEQT